MSQSNGMSIKIVCKDEHGRPVFFGCATRQDAEYMKQFLTDAGYKEIEIKEV